MKDRRRAITIILAVAFLNHLLTFLAYEWYAGIDSYSYDVCGMQLVSGVFFDIFPVMFREPFVPIVKNILYLIFEGHPYILGILIHTLGIVTSLWAYRLGERFNRVIGFLLGLFTAAYLPVSVHFHHISITTFFIPILVITADRIAAWLKKPTLAPYVAYGCQHCMCISD